MIDLGPHAAFIWAAYGVTVVGVGTLIFLTLMDDRRQRAALAELERQGITRRSAKPAPAKITPKTQPQRAPVKSGAKAKSHRPARRRKSKT
jgi:heme exporter protein D